MEIVNSYSICNEYIDHVKNKYKISRKSIYQRQYHIKNILINISFENKINISHQETQKIIESFKILPIIFQERRRMPSVMFVIKKVLQLLNNKNWECIKTPKNKKHIIMLEKCWSTIM